MSANHVNVSLTIDERDAIDNAKEHIRHLVGAGFCVVDEVIDTCELTEIFGAIAGHIATIDDTFEAADVRQNRTGGAR